MTATKLRIVIADDTPDIRDLLRITLRRQGGFDVIAEAGDGLRAVELAREHQPDAVLLDLAMPRMDGLEAIPRILEASPDTRIVVLSGFESSVMANEALQRGAHAYLAKGTVAFGIAAKLREVCGVPAAEAPARLHASADSDSDLVSVLLHELRNQVTVVEGFAVTLARGWEDIEESVRRELLDRIVRNAGQFGSLIDAFADAHDAQTGGFDLALQRLAVGPLVREIVDDLEGVVDRPVHIQVSGDAPIDVDPIRIRQILTNLLSNAAKFGPAGTPIEVTVVAGQDCAEVAVRDQGPGVPADRRQELFQPFARLGAHQPGTGLGLYVSRGLARAHGGDLVFDDATPSTFVLRLPTSADAEV